MTSSARPLPLLPALPALLVGVAATVAGCGAPAKADAPHAVEASARGHAAKHALFALFAEEWEHELDEHPVWASTLGDLRGADRWDDVSLAAQAKRRAHDQEVLAKLATIPRDVLSVEDALSHDLFRAKYAESIEAYDLRAHLFPINQRGGIQTEDDVADALPFDKVEHFAAWNARLRALPTYMDQTIELLAEGAKTGMTHPKVVMDRLPGQIGKQIVGDPSKSPFFAPYTKVAASFPAGDRARLAQLEAEAKGLVASAVVPAFVKLKAFFEKTYYPACKDEIGAHVLPNGAAYYAFQVRSHTTTKLSPDEVHAIGLREVARIRGEMEAVTKKTGFKGSTKEFFAFLRTDPRFFYKDGASLLAGYRDLSKRIDPLLVKQFAHLPRTPYGVSPIPDHVAPDTTSAYYREPAADGSRAGTYFVNVYKPEARPKWEMVALTLHESVPGHHLQIALAMEQEGLPEFRKHLEYSAYVEGWALYAESLGEELGVYDDPYAKMGQLTYEMWRAVRLVVDTGIHHLKWDRKRAIDFFMENAPKAELDVVNEVDRYIAWPGQALAYKIGELEIKKLKKQRQSKEGDRFDLKTFHDDVLKRGPMPLDVLARLVTEGH